MFLKKTAPFAGRLWEATPSLMTVDIIVILKTGHFYENNVEYYHEVSVFTKILYFCFGIESTFEAVVPWYHVTVENRSFFLP